MAATLGFIGRGLITDREAAKLRQFGRYAAAAGKPVYLVPAKGAAAAFEEGVQEQDGEVRHLERDVLSTAAHTFIYADERLYRRLLEACPNLPTLDSVTLAMTELELDLWLQAAHDVLVEKGVTPPS